MSLARTMLRNAPLVAPIALVQCGAHFAFNHWPLREPTYLPLTWVDEAVPFLPWTIWPYFLMIAGQIALALMIDRRDIFRQTLAAYLIGVSITIAIHAAWPTAIARPTPPADDCQALAFQFLCEADAPNSCFPSGHVVGPAILVWGYYRNGSVLGPWLLAAFVPLSLSILTTKQHYFWDWLGAHTLVDRVYWYVRCLEREGGKGTRRLRRPRFSIASIPLHVYDA